METPNERTATCFSARQFREAMGPGYQVPMPFEPTVLYQPGDLCRCTAVRH